MAELLYNSFVNEGIHGHKTMPEDESPQGVERGSLEHLLFITLTVAIDYQHDVPACLVALAGNKLPNTDTRSMLLIFLSCNTK